MLRFAFVAAALAAAAPASAQSLSPDQAHRFIAGKYFAFNCFDGTRGAGRIYGDGSVSGNIHIAGQAGPRYVVLPAGTLRVKGASYCASLRGLPFEPCFNLNRTDEQSFRGSVSGFNFAYCDFTRRNVRPAPVRSAWRLRPSQPLALDPPAVAAEGTN